MYCVLCSVYCHVCTVYFVLCTVTCELCTVTCVLCTVTCVLCTVTCVLCTVYCHVCTVYCVLCTVYCVLCTHKITSYKIFCYHDLFLTKVLHFLKFATLIRITIWWHYKYAPWTYFSIVFIQSAMAYCYKLI